MNKEQMTALISVVLLGEVYRDGRFSQEGETITVPRYEFSTSLMVAVDSDGMPLAVQPTELAGADVHATVFGRRIVRVPIVADTLAAAQAPVQQAPVQQAPVQQAPVQQAPVQQSDLDLVFNSADALI